MPQPISPWCSMRERKSPRTTVPGAVCPGCYGRRSGPDAAEAGGRLGHDCRRRRSATSTVRCKILRRRDQRVLRIGGELLAAIGALRRGAIDVGALAGGDHDLLPAGAVGVIAVLVAQRSGRGVHVQVGSDPQDRHAAGAFIEHRSRPARTRGVTARPPTSIFKTAAHSRACSAARRSISSRGLVGVQLPFLQQLEGGDLGEVQHVADVAPRRRSVRCGCSG